MTEVITLQPGSSSYGGGPDLLTRRDWSPIAQMPDKHDVIAHTPDPSAYHDLGGRTMLPRHHGNFGESKGFTIAPGVVNVDPADPVRGLGGITVDLATVSKEDFAMASEQAAGNPLYAWSLASQRQKTAVAQPVVVQPVQPVQPAMSIAAALPMPVPTSHVSSGGYVAPHVNLDGTPIPMEQGVRPGWDVHPASPVRGVAAGAMPTGPMPVVNNPAVKPRTSPMTMPQATPAPWETGAQIPAQPAAMSPVLAPTPHPETQQVAAPVAAQVTPAVEQPPQHGEVRYHEGRPYQFDAGTGGWQLYVPPQPAPVQQATAPVASQPTQFEQMMLQTMQAIGQKLDSLGNGHAKAASTVPAKTVMAPGPGRHEVWEDEKESMVTEELVRRRLQVEQESQLQTPYAQIGMPFLGELPFPPRTSVIFHQPGGMFKTRYHHVARRGICLSLISDSRYDGDQYIPATTPEGETLRIQVPSMELDAEAVVFDYHNTIGCLDILNVILVDRDRMSSGPPIATGQTTDEIQSLMQTGSF